MKAEWMPDYKVTFCKNHMDCEDCGKPDICDGGIDYVTGVYDGVESVLEYLIKIAKAWPRNEHGDYYVRGAELESMLKELEEK